VYNFLVFTNEKSYIFDMVITKPINIQNKKVMATKKAKKAAPKKAAKKAAPKKAVKKAAPKKAAKKAAPKKAVKKAAPKKAKVKRKPNAAFMKALTPSADLGAVIGAKPLPRTEAVKKIWVYIKANKLQDSKNRRMINADAKLKVVFGGKAQVSMFDMAKHLSKHLK
jgi:chromatin remodeling complex protein RSC6